MWRIFLEAISGDFWNVNFETAKKQRTENKKQKAASKEQRAKNGSYRLVDREQIISALYLLTYLPWRVYHIYLALWSVLCLKALGVKSCFFLKRLMKRLTLLKPTIYEISVTL